MLPELLSSRRLPPLKSRGEMLETLLENEYGVLPETDVKIAVGKETVLENRLDLGRAALSEVPFTVTTPFGSHTFPLKRLLHHDGKKRPFVVFMDFSDRAPSFYFPVERVAERGFDVLSFCYTDVTSDDGDFTSGLAPLLLPQGQNTPDAAGKLRIWAFAASRVLDYAETLPGLDMPDAAVLGHSRLGKTALLAGATDERFRFVLSNNAGCAGDSLARGGLGRTGQKGKHGGPGESVAAISRVFPFWFCKNYLRYAETNEPAGFDQHDLLACIAPRFVHVGIADMDDWADPVSQKLCCLAASPAWEETGLPGFVYDDVLPAPGDAAMAGRVGCHCRSGPHFLSYRDWEVYLDFIEGHIQRYT
ncbi:MAG: hypothetical protein IJK02_12025 [Clostridia bacterium]|nr:hypothetical protein [Clostridia bacterium]MBR0537744.1 hypothetical protein [Clostridia bacterium]